jgi:predicted Fe-Mo cluster-binding NifX family protein
MKVAVPASGTAPTASVEARFARAPLFLVFDTEDSSWATVENTQVLNAVQGAGIQAAETLVRCGVHAVLTTHCGPKAFRALMAAGVTVYTGVTGTIADAMHALLADRLTPAAQADVEGHW